MAGEPGAVTPRGGGSPDQSHSHRLRKGKPMTAQNSELRRVWLRELNWATKSERGGWPDFELESIRVSAAR